MFSQPDEHFHKLISEFQLQLIALFGNLTVIILLRTVGFPSPNARWNYLNESFQHFCQKFLSIIAVKFDLFFSKLILNNICIPVF